MLAKRVDIIQEAFRTRMEPFKAELAARQGVAEKYVDYGIAICTGVMTGILIRWIENDKQQAPDDLAIVLGGMISKMVTLDQLF